MDAYYKVRRCDRQTSAESRAVPAATNRPPGPGDGLCTCFDACIKPLEADHAFQLGRRSAVNQTFVQQCCSDICVACWLLTIAIDSSLMIMQACKSPVESESARKRKRLVLAADHDLSPAGSPLNLSQRSEQTIEQAFGSPQRLQRPPVTPTKLSPPAGEPASYS